MRGVRQLPLLEAPAANCPASRQEYRYFWKSWIWTRAKTEVFSNSSKYQVRRMGRAPSNTNALLSKRGESTAIFIRHLTGDFHCPSMLGIVGHQS